MSCVLPDLYDHRSACVSGSSGTETLVADSSEEDGHGGELRTGDPALVSHGEGENNEENRKNEIKVWLKVIPSKVGLCLLHIQAGFEACQQRCQGTEVLPSLQKIRGKTNTSSS